ncbi:LURP-one-related/scramblase family protein [Limosilactobacillus frumenti]|uniref:LURP-one-related/scramblase family protein n=1 Tax=Limosilactobacillus frumenti TaxID=104955 RepID=UPI000710C783|nr:hypothetical protein [Limosilactobacillus frumenti]MBA2913708.1 hypothetical protein [Limosilactobacillus frumenti]QFG72217.1 hypothetical protein LF145_02050 [Limosilactobacillus frumenti]
MRLLYLRDHDTDLHGTTVIRDYQGRSCYLLVGKWGMLHDVLSLYSISGELLAEVKQQSFGILPRFALYLNRHQVGTVSKSLGFLREVIYIRGLNWVVVGSPFSDKYRVFQAQRKVFSIRPVAFTGDYYHELKVNQEADEPLAILVASVLQHWARRKQGSPLKVRWGRRADIDDGFSMSFRNHN